MFGIKTTIWRFLTGLLGRSPFGSSSSEKTEEKKDEPKFTIQEGWYYDSDNDELMSIIKLADDEFLMTEEKGGSRIINSKGEEIKGKYDES